MNLMEYEREFRRMQNEDKREFTRITSDEVVGVDVLGDPEKMKNLHKILSTK